MFQFNPNTIQSLEASISPQRLGTYLQSTGNDAVAALRLYRWNIDASQAFWGPLHAMEVALRNAAHRELSNVYGPSWYSNAAAGLTAGTQRKIRRATLMLTQRGKSPTTPRIVAELTFGFWVRLFSNSHPDRANRQINYETTLWRPALHRMFAPRPPQRSAVHARLLTLQKLRNRIAHHEPIVGRNLNGDYFAILEVLGGLCADTKDWVESHFDVKAVLARWP